MCKNSARIHKNVENAQRLTSHQQREAHMKSEKQRERRECTSNEHKSEAVRERGSRERRSMLAEERQSGRAAKTAVRALRVRKALD